MTLSAIEAIREGRTLYPNYVSGSLVSLRDSEGNELSLNASDSLIRYDEFDNEQLPIGKISCGSACLLGAQGLGMGLPLHQLGVDDGFYCHPDFYTNEADRKSLPNGFTYNQGNAPIGIKTAACPCTCMTWSQKVTWIPEIIAHLNDTHDPRYRDHRKDDPFSEAKIVDWIRSLGYKDSTLD